MATINQTFTTNFVARKMGEFHENFNPILNTANRKYVEQYEMPGYATNGTILIKQDGYPQTTTGLVVTTPQAIDDVVLPFTITENDIYNVTYQWNLFQYKFDLVGGAKALTGKQEEELVDNYAWPAYESMRVFEESVAAFRLKTNAFYCSVNDPDNISGFTNYSSVSSINKLMNRFQFKSAERYLMMNLDDANNVANSLQNMFNQAINEKITRTSYVNGTRDKSRLAGLDMYQSNQLEAHISGPLSDTTTYPSITVGSISGDGTQITFVVGGTSSAQLVNAGDRFAIQDIHLLAPIGKAVTTKTLVVTAELDADGDGAGNVTITMPYPLLISGMHANVDALPTAGMAVKAFPATYNLNFAYVPSGLSAVPLRLDPIYGANNSTEQGLNSCPVSVILQGQVLEFSNVFRLSQLLGIRAFAPYIIAIPTAIDQE